MRLAVAAVLIVLAASLPHAQNPPDHFDPKIAVPKAWALLTAAVKTDASADQRDALGALAAARTPRSLSLLREVARNGSPGARDAALWVLPPEPTDLSLLAEALKDSNPRVRQTAIQTLSRLRDARAAELLRGVLMTGDADQVERAVSSLRLLAPLSLTPLLQCLDTCPDLPRRRSGFTIQIVVDPDFSAAAAENLRALRRLRPEPLLLRSLADDDRDLRVSAALVLARLGRRESIDELIQATAYPRVGMVLSKYRAMAALVVLGKSEYLSPLVAGLRNEDPNGRWDAVYAMQSLPDQSMYDANHAAWKGTSNIRSGAFRVLLAVGGSRNRALLREGLADREPAIRLLAAEALLALGRDAASVTVLEQLARDEPRGRVKAFSILTAKGSPRETASVARAVLPTSSNDLRGGQVYDLDNRLVAIHAIEMVRDRESVGALTAIFGMDQSVSSRVAQALIAIGDDASGRALVQAMDHPSSFVRINAAGGVISLYDR